jgi:heme-degrading monooxygenase HmoA
MFARVVTAEAGAEGFEKTISLAKQQVPAASQQPGFKGFYLLTNAETGKLITISLWETQEHMQAVEAAEAAKAAKAPDQQATGLGLTPPQLETYDVAMHA